MTLCRNWRGSLRSVHQLKPEYWMLDQGIFRLKAIIGSPIQTSSHHGKVISNEFMQPTGCYCCGLW